MSDDAIAGKKCPFSGRRRMPKCEPVNQSWLDGGQVKWLTAGIAIVQEPREKAIAVGETGLVHVSIGERGEARGFGRGASRV
jgi:hypothetical protein